MTEIQEVQCIRVYETHMLRISHRKISWYEYLGLGLSKNAVDILWKTHSISVPFFVRWREDMMLETAHNHYCFLVVQR